MHEFHPFYVTTLSAVEQMAADEALLSEGLEHPILSVYQWAEKAVTGGRGTSEELLEKLATEKGITNYSKRRSGGGIVFHEKQAGLTYAIAIPRLKLNEIGSINAFYTWLHESIQQLLLAHGVPCYLASEGKSTSADPCFTHPVTADLLSASGKKIAGAGIWVSKKGFLIQGEIQPEQPVQWQKDKLNFLDFTVWQAEVS